MLDSAPSVVVLGAAGFIGAAVRRHLADRYRLLSVDVRPPPWPSVDADETMLTMDLGDVGQVERLFDQIAERLHDVAGVINLAAYYDFRNTPDPRYGALEKGLARFLELAKTRIPPQAPLLYASSMAAMAPTEPGIKQTADSPRAGLWQYPAHKLRSERILEASDVPQPRVELVLAAVYSDWCELVPLFQHIERIRTRSSEMLFYPGSTNRGLTYVHLNDTARAFARGLEVFRGRPGVHRLLIGEDRPTTYGQIQNAAQSQFLGRRLPVLPVPKPLAYAGAGLIAGASGVLGKRPFIQPWMIEFAGEHFEFDLSETDRVLDWMPTQSLAKALPAILQRADDDSERWLQLNRARPW